MQAIKTHLNNSIKFHFGAAKLSTKDMCFETLEIVFKTLFHSTKRVVKSKKFDFQELEFNFECVSMKNI